MKNFKKICLGVGLAALFAVIIQILPPGRALADVGPFAYNEWDHATYALSSKTKITVSFGGQTQNGQHHDDVTFSNSSPGTYTADGDNRAFCSGTIKFNKGQTTASHPISASIDIKIVEYRAQGGTDTSCRIGGDTYNNNGKPITITNTLQASGAPADTGPGQITYGNKTFTQVGKTPTNDIVYGLKTDTNDCYGGAILVLNAVDTKKSGGVTGTIVGLTTPPNQSGAALSKLVNLPANFPMDSPNGVCMHQDNGQDAVVTVDTAGKAKYKSCPAGENDCDQGQVKAANTDPSDTTSSCESNFDSGFEWVLCPAFKLADSAAGAFNTFIEGQLCFKTNAIPADSAGISTNSNTSSTGSSVVCGGNNNLDSKVHNAWNIFKNLASALIVIALLIMIISQAIGAGPFDAYTVRKMLPKLVAAVMLMQISWFLLKWAIDLSNDAGAAIGNLIMAPFGGSSNLSLDKLMAVDFNGHTVGTNNTFAFFTVIAAGTAAFIVSIPTLALMALYVVMALLTAFVVLIFRKLLIILLVILAPLAFVAWVMPGMDKYWTLWRTHFTKLLLMFPMIMGLLAAGRVFADITAGDSGVMFAPHLGIAHLGSVPIPYIASVSSFADILIVIAAWFGPYFFLPQTYKWGGSALGAIGKGVQQAMEKGSHPAKEYLKWRQGLSPWKQARERRKAIQTQQAHAKFAEHLIDDGTKGRLTRARLYGVTRRKANQEIVKKAVLAARGEQAQEANKETQAIFDALALDLSNKNKGSASDFAAGNETTQLGVLGKKFRETHDDTERQAILKKVAQLKDVEAIKQARDMVGPTEWQKFSTSGYLYDDFKSLDPQLFQDTRGSQKGFFTANQSIDHTDDLLAGLTEDGFRDFWTEASTANTIRDPATGALRVETAAEVSLKQSRAIEAIRRIQASPASVRLDNKVRGYMETIIPAPPPVPTVAPGAVIPPGARVAPGSRRAEIIGMEDANLILEIGRMTRVVPGGATLQGWEAVPEADLLRIFRFRTGELKDNAAKELQKRGRFPAAP